MELAPSTKSHPSVFYGHEDLYQPHRGPYASIYEPKKVGLPVVGQSQQETGFSLTDVFYRNALDEPTPLNDEMVEAFRHSKTSSSNTICLPCNVMPTTQSYDYRFIGPTALATRSDTC